MVIVLDRIAFLLLFFSWLCFALWRALPECSGERNIEIGLYRRQSAVKQQMIITAATGKAGENEQVMLTEYNREERR